MIEDVIRDINDNGVDTIFFKSYRCSDDYFTLFGLNDKSTKICRIVWINEVNKIFNEFNIKFDIDLLLNSERIPIN